MQYSVGSKRMQGYDIFQLDNPEQILPWAPKMQGPALGQFDSYVDISLPCLVSCRHVLFFFFNHHCTAEEKQSPSHCLEGYPPREVSQSIRSTPRSQHS